MPSRWSIRSSSRPAPVWRRTLGWGIAAVTTLVVAAALVPAGAAPSARGVRHRVDIHRFTFVPERLVVEAGDTVVWVNRDLVPHTVTAHDEGWDSGTLEANQTWERRMTETLTESYFCRHHPMMRGQVRVRSRDGGAGP